MPEIEVEKLVKVKSYRCDEEECISTCDSMTLEVESGCKWLRINDPEGKQTKYAAGNACWLFFCSWECVAIWAKKKHDRLRLD